MTQGSQSYIAIPPDLNSWLRLLMQNFSSNINCHTIGTINTFNHLTQTAVISINYIRVFYNANPNPSALKGENTPQNVYQNYPLLVQCPVVILQGGGAYLTFPIKPGDTCVVLFNDREISTWLNTGQITYPQNQNAHDLSDGIALIGIRNTLPGNPIQNYNTEAVSLVDNTGERLLQSGMMMAYGGASAPTGWLLCQGQSLSRDTYPLLFTAIGTTYGSADGSHFTLPDMRGQVAAGIGGTLGLTLGQEFGEVEHTLTIGEIPAHTHLNITDPDSYSGGGGSVGPGNTSGATGSTGGGDSHNNVQPSLGVNWIIKI